MKTVGWIIAVWAAYDIVAANSLIIRNIGYFKKVNFKKHKRDIFCVFKSLIADLLVLIYVLHYLLKS